MSGGRAIFFELLDRSGGNSEMDAVMWIEGIAVLLGD